MGCFVKLTTTVVLLAGVQLGLTETTLAATPQSRAGEIKICATLPESFGDIACPKADGSQQDPAAPGATGTGGGR